LHGTLLHTAAHTTAVNSLAFLLAGQPGSFVSVLLKLPANPSSIAAFLHLPEGTAVVLRQHVNVINATDDIDLSFAEECLAMKQSV
jgi:hypothetical protein